MPCGESFIVAVFGDAVDHTLVVFDTISVWTRCTRLDTKRVRDVLLAWRVWTPAIDNAEEFRIVVKCAVFDGLHELVVGDGDGTSKPWRIQGVCEQAAWHS